jgi:hypothetical protein
MHLFRLNPSACIQTTISAVAASGSEWEALPINTPAMRSTEKLVSSWAVMRSAPQWARLLGASLGPAGLTLEMSLGPALGRRYLGRHSARRRKLGEHGIRWGKNGLSLRDIGGGLGRSAGRRRARKLGFGEVARTSTWKHWGWSWEFQSGSVHHTELCWEWYWSLALGPVLGPALGVELQKGLGKMRPALGEVLGTVLGSALGSALGTERCWVRTRGLAGEQHSERNSVSGGIVLGPTLGLTRSRSQSITRS